MTVSTPTIRGKNPGPIWPFWIRHSMSNAITV